MQKDIIYLDYSATTPVNDEVLKVFTDTAKKYIGNPNSAHRLGQEANKLIKQSTTNISKILKIQPQELIYTSGSSESNNLAIKGFALKNQNKGHHIISTLLEHSSVIAPLSYLQKNGFEIDFVNILDNGQVDIEHLKSLIRDDTILVSICAVDSEVGTRQPIEEIGHLLSEYPNISFHSDITQCLGKDLIDLTHVDLASFSAHKIYGFKGIGGLIKKEGIMLEPLIHGGKSVTIFRSGTPTTELIASLSKALELATKDLEQKKKYIEKINLDLKNFLQGFANININSSIYSLPNVLNFSIMGVKPEAFQHALEQDNIFISTKSACSLEDAISKSVYAITKNKEYASSSLRISLSSLTTIEEITKFKESFLKNYRKLVENK